jgi:hypothetical protein
VPRPRSEEQFKPIFSIDLTLRLPFVHGLVPGSLEAGMIYDLKRPETAHLEILSNLDVY